MWLKKISSKKIRPKKILPATLVLTVIIVAGIGTYLLTGSHAATPYTSTTADNGALSNGATSQNCTGSSDGKCVVFSASTNSNLIFDGTFPSSGDITFGNAVWNSPNNRNNPTQSGPAITGAVDPLGSGQNVGKMTVTPQDINPCCNDARTDLESPYLMSPTMNSDVYISIPVFVPMSTVALMYGHQNNGFMVEENYGPPYNGSPTNQVNVKATSTSAFKYAYSWNDILGTYGPANDSNDQWYSPSITTDVWHTITEHIMW
ncbi:MAG TPA: hypothetical protein VNG32_01020, partial [Candidatus Dormibacteraeota bacterium]|nr:hypothetical protein [Candidatus Dormibacteraeota bacterium]